MMRRLSLLVVVAMPIACTREPAHSAVEPTSAAPVSLQNGGPTGATDPAPGAAQVSTQPAPSPPPQRAAATPASPDATSNPGTGPKIPSSTQARDTPPPAQVPNAMPAPDPL